MPYTILCQCGIILEVAPMQAGSAIACECGQVVEVPSMSALRKSAGESAIPLNIVEKVHGMVHRGELPTNTTCPLSGQLAKVTLFVKVQCERTYVHRGTPKDLQGFFSLFASYLSSDKSGARTVGRDVSVDVPVLIAADQQQRFLNTRSQSQLQDWLRTTPIYEQLLEEYPEAILTPYVP